MGKAAVPRLLVPSLVVIAVAVAAWFLRSHQPAGTTADPGSPVAKTPPPPKKPALPDRPDAEIWVKWQGKPMAEILGALAPPAPNPTETIPAPPDSAPAAAPPDPYLPWFSTTSNDPLPGAEDAAIAGQSIVFSSVAGPAGVKPWPNPASDAGFAFPTLPAGQRVLPADFDRDGDTDWFVGRAGNLPNSLWRNDGTGTCEDVTEALGLLEFLDFADAAWVDYDRDGWPDLAIVNHSAKGATDSLFRLLHNDSGTRFTEVTTASHLTSLGRLRDMIWHDFDDDGYPDLILSAVGTPGQLKMLRSISTESGRAFEPVPSNEALAAGGPLAIADFNGDGQEELVVASDQTLSGLRLSPVESLFSFTGVAHPLTVVARDFDLDGASDLVLFGETETKAWRNLGDFQFEELPGAAGLPSGKTVGRVVPLDALNAGQPTWLITSAGKSQIYRQSSPLIFDRARVILHLKSPESADPDARGAKVFLTTRDRNWVYRTLSRTFDGSTESIGLDEASAIESLEIVWPD
ncbi:MAG: CRTAC1 family protein, partial [Verrucomicrobiae bacterium]|nr:CRTAC1 family protein [Verrucomicrobiae bacterium]